MRAERMCVCIWSPRLSYRLLKGQRRHALHWLPCSWGPGPCYNRLYGTVTGSICQWWWRGEIEESEKAKEGSKERREENKQREEFRAENPTLFRPPPSNDLTLPAPSSPPRGGLMHEAMGTQKTGECQLWLQLSGSISKLTHHLLTQ